jgi:hypothetical protein
MMMKGKLKTHGKSALERSLTFEENEILTKAMGYLKRTLNYEEVEIESLGSGLAHLEKLENENSSTGAPNAGFDQFGYNRAIIEASQPGSPAVCPSLSLSLSLLLSFFQDKNISFC